MKKVLIITYYWPPASSPGVFRFLKFSKYLVKRGYEPYVLTVRNGTYPSLDPSLVEEINPGIKVFKTKTMEPFSIYSKFVGNKTKSLPVGLVPQENDSIKKRIMHYIRANFFIPDARKGWNFFAYKKAKEIIIAENISQIITTGPPHSTHLVGLKLKNNLKIKWIADFRDPWTNIFYNQFFPRTKKTEKKDFLLETSVLTNADCSVVVSNGLYDEFKNRARRIEFIPNGFDLNDIPERKSVVTQKFIMAYVGNFKPNQNIDFFWEAIKELKAEIEDFQNLFRLKITGNCHCKVLECIKNYGISDLVEIEGHVSHEKAITRMLESNLLLFIIPRALNNKLILTGKLFEYLASRAPVLSIGPLGGDADRLLDEKNRGKMVDYDDIKGMKRIILNYYTQWLGDKKLFKTSYSDINDYNREKLTEKLTGILDSL